MDSRIEAIKVDLQGTTEKLDALISGRTVGASHLIERLIGDLEGVIRSELPLIDKAIST